jgi:ubiquinone/menaquinone biosynthesis C-methylase UbiE
MAEVKKLDKSEKFWDRTAKNFDQQDDPYDPGYVRTIQEYLGPGDTVLDFACGTGSFSCLIADDVKEIHAIDISSQMLEIAKEKAQALEIKNINFMHATILNQKLKEGSFDVILAFNILHLLENTTEVIQRINRLLKPGGIFISDTPCLGEKRNWVAFVIAMISKLPILPYVKNFSVAELEAKFTGSNFKIIESEILSNTPTTSLVVARKE